MKTLAECSASMPDEIRLSQSNLRAYAAGRLYPALNARKFGKTWLVTDADFARWLRLYQLMPRNKAASVRNGWPRSKKS